MTLEEAMSLVAQKGGTVAFYYESWKTEDARYFPVVAGKAWDCYGECAFAEFFASERHPNELSVYVTDGTCIHSTKPLPLTKIGLGKDYNLNGWRALYFDDIPVATNFWEDMPTSLHCG
jgi:hypothetical protein